MPSWAAGETLTVDFFDIGDGNLGTGSLQLVFSSGDGVYGTAGSPIGEFQGCSSSTLRTSPIQNKPTPWALDQNPRDSDWGALA